MSRNSQNNSKPRKNYKAMEEYGQKRITFFIHCAT